MYRRLGLILIALSFLANCSQRIQKSELLSRFSQEEALFADIVTPLASHPHSCERHAGAVSLSYLCSLSPEEMYRLYCSDMERYGWRLQVQFLGSESMLLFEKPRRFCVVTLRQVHTKRPKHGQLLTIVTGRKGAVSFSENLA